MGTLVDIQDGGELHTTWNNRTTKRIAIVDELEGSDPDAMLYDAELTLAGLGTPIEIGSAHPTIPSLIVVAFDTYPLKRCATARVEIVYGLPDFFGIPPDLEDDGPDQKEIRFITQPKEYTTDPLNSSNDLVVSAPPKYSGRPDQIKTVVVNEGLEVLTFVRTEPSIPTARARTYRNKVNSVGLGTGTLYPAGTVYCNAIVGTKTGSDLPRVRYEFTVNEEGFDIEYRWERPPLDVPAYDANSRKMLTPYDEIDFTALGLNWDD